MKSIEKIAKIYAEEGNYELRSFFYTQIKDAFFDGFAEAEKFYIIERSPNGELAKECKNEISNYTPFLAQSKYGHYVVCDSVLYIESRTEFIKWRPIKRK